jgi:hypothetical protein
MAGRIRGAWRRTRRLRWLTVVAGLVFLAWAWFANGYVEPPSTACSEPIDTPSHVRDLVVGKTPGYRRAESSTYLTLPEWYIVYNSEEYKRTLQHGRPSAFPYFRSVAQYWRYYYRVFKITQAKYGFNAGDHLMLVVIGVSTSVENTLKGLYENTAGRLTEWLATTDTPEDRFAAKTAADYAQFIHTVPFYDFDYASRLSALWKDMPSGAPHPVRRWERKAILSVEYGLKAGYGWLIRKGTKAVYGNADERVLAWVQRLPPAIVLVEPRVQRVTQPTYDSDLISIPRYEPFREVVTTLVGQGVRFVEIAGNNDLLLTATAPATWKGLRGWNVVLTEPILTEPGKIRIAVVAPVRCLDMLLPALATSGATVEHFYDY